VTSVYGTKNASERELIQLSDAPWPMRWQTRLSAIGAWRRNF